MTAHRDAGEAELANRSSIARRVLEHKHGRKIIGGLLVAAAIGATIWGAYHFAKTGDTGMAPAPTGSMDPSVVPSTENVLPWDMSGQEGPSATTSVSPTAETATPPATTSSVETTSTPIPKDIHNPDGVPTPTADVTASPPTTEATPTSYPTDINNPDGIAPAESPAAVEPAEAPRDINDPDEVGSKFAPGAESAGKRAVIELGSSVYETAQQQLGLSGTEVANALNDGTLHVMDASGKPVANIDMVRPGDYLTLDTLPAQEVAPAEAVRMNPNGGTLIDSVHEMMEANKMDTSPSNLQHVTEAVMEYNRNLGVPLDWNTAKSIQVSTVNGVPIAELNGQALRMPTPEEIKELLDQE